MTARMGDRLLRLRVLVVDALDDCRRTLRWRLQTEGADVMEASGPADAVVLARSEPYDVALVASTMIDGCGEDVIASLAAAAPAMAIVAVIGNPPDVRRTRALAAGAARAVGQPVDWDALFRYLETGPRFSDIPRIGGPGTLHSNPALPGPSSLLGP